MRQIHKKSSPEWFEKWKTDYVIEKGKKPKYDDLEDPDRIKLRKQLVEEQGYICCYCMRRISVSDSHIEHLKPRDIYKNLELDYNNMFASCTGQENELRDSLKHCDPRKNNWYSALLPDLTDSEIEKCIEYSINGEVRPYHEANDKRREVELDMIENLGLQAPYLVRNRKRAIDESEIMDDVDYSADDWNSFIEYYDSMHNGKYEEYCTALIRVIIRECI